MIDKMIRARCVEIVLVVLLVLATIPIWNGIEIKLSNDNITILEEYNDNFDRALNNYFVIKNQGQFMKTSRLFTIYGLFSL